MDRKGFLKRVFGAAVVAAMPKVVVNQIESLPAPVEEKEPIFLDKVTEKPIIPNISERILFIYDKEKLIGYSAQFDLSSKMDTMYYRIYVDDLEWYTQPLIPPKYTLSANRIHWIVNPEDLFASQQTLDFLIKYNELTLNGQMYISSLHLSFNVFEQGEYSSEFEIIGAVAIETA